MRAGAHRWGVAQSDEPGGFSPVLNFAALGNAWSSIGLRSVDADGIGQLLSAWSI